MKHISLDGLDVSRIGLGAMAMSGYYLDPDSSDAESIRTIHRALDLGVTHVLRQTINSPTNALTRTHHEAHAHRGDAPLGVKQRSRGRLARVRCRWA
jgi:hypothetical protein